MFHVFQIYLQFSKLHKLWCISCSMFHDRNALKSSKFPWVVTLVLISMMTQILPFARRRVAWANHNSPASFPTRHRDPTSSFKTPKKHDPKMHEAYPWNVTSGKGIRPSFCEGDSKSKETSPNPLNFPTTSSGDLCHDQTLLPKSSPWVSWVSWQSWISPVPRRWPVNMVWSCMVRVWSTWVMFPPLAFTPKCPPTFQDVDVFQGLLSAMTMKWIHETNFTWNFVSKKRKVRDRTCTKVDDLRHQNRVLYIIIIIYIRTAPWQHVIWPSTTSFLEFSISICLSSGPESFQQCGRVGRTSGDRFPPLWATSDGLLFGSPLRFGEGAFHHLSSLTGWPRRFQPQFGEDTYMVGVSKFLSGWAPNISSLVAYFLSMLSTWGDQTFALVLCSLTGLPRLMDVPNVLRCSGLLLIGVGNWSMVWTTGLETSSLLPWLSSWTCSSSWPPPTQIMKSRMRLTRSLTNAEQEGLMRSGQLGVLFLLCCNLLYVLCWHQSSIKSAAFWFSSGLQSTVSSCFQSTW